MEQKILCWRWRGTGSAYGDADDDTLDVGCISSSPGSCRSGYNNREQRQGYGIEEGHAWL